MRRKGIMFRVAHHLTFRGPREGDEDEYGDPILPHHQVIVRKSDCRDEWGSAGSVPRRAAPMHGTHVHGLTNMIYGAWRKKKDSIYYTCPVYWIENALVYRGTVHHVGALLDQEDP